MLATVEFLGLVGYEVLIAYAMKAFWPMNQKKKIIYLFWALLPLALMTMFHSESIGNDTQAYTELFDAVCSSVEWPLREGIYAIYICPDKVVFKSTMCSNCRRSYCISVSRSVAK